MSKDLIKRLEVAASVGTVDNFSAISLFRDALGRLGELEQTVQDIRDVLPELPEEAAGVVIGALGDHVTPEPKEPERRPLMYAIGIETSAGVYGMTHGPFPTREDALAIDGDETDAQVIIRFSPSGQEAVCYRWQDDRWQRARH